MIWFALAYFVAGIAWACRKYFTRYPCQKQGSDHPFIQLNGDVTEDWLEDVARAFFPHNRHGFTWTNGSNHHLAHTIELLKYHRINTRRAVADLYLYSEFATEFDLMKEYSNIEAVKTGCSCEYLLWKCFHNIGMNLPEPITDNTVAFAAGQSGATTARYVGVHFNNEAANYPEVPQYVQRLCSRSQSNKLWLFFDMLSYCGKLEFWLSS